MPPRHAAAGGSGPPREIQDVDTGAGDEKSDYPWPGRPAYCVLILVVMGGIMSFLDASVFSTRETDARQLLDVLVNAYRNPHAISAIIDRVGIETVVCERALHEAEVVAREPPLRQPRK